MTDRQRRIALSLYREGFCWAVTSAPDQLRPEHRARGQEHVTAGVWAGRRALAAALAEYGHLLGEERP